MASLPAAVAHVVTARAQGVSKHMDPAALRQAKIELLTTGLSMTEGREPTLRAVFLLNLIEQAEARYNAVEQENVDDSQGTR